ncbi:Hypothetical predicted protein [Paramuricea clavata]|uniref:Uncharacterized protein n=1 Tax=Paramuricea clavata TaxID=317549 RepID=A0A6S7GPZ4_PARCT|nr:Hypothetical predicted protein [Paramuricea clavata]
MEWSFPVVESTTRERTTSLGSQEEGVLCEPSAARNVWSSSSNHDFCPPYLDDLLRDSRSFIRQSIDCISNSKSCGGVIVVAEFCPPHFWQNAAQSSLGEQFIIVNEEAKLDTKLTQLRLTAQRTVKILDAGKRETIEQHLKALQTTISETDQYKRTVEAEKIGKEEDLAEISDWNTEIEAKIGEAEVNRLQQWLGSKKMEEENYAREEQLKFEVKLGETKLQMQAKIQDANPGEHNTSKTETGEGMKETVDKSNIAAINKFTYLCGFLGPKVKRRVESLPFTAEGYNRAKSILQDQYGKTPEIVKAYIKEIMDLPHISAANPKKIAEFSEKLNYGVQALDKLHHTSICDAKDRDDKATTERKVLTASGSTAEGIFPVVVVKVNGITCRALIDSGAGSSYISGKLASMLNVKPIKSRTSKIDMLLTSRTTRLDIYEAKVESVDGDYAVDVNLIKVEKGELLTIDNPHDKLQSEFDHLKQAKFIDCKSEATDILGDATFSLHKWASNVNELDGESDNNKDREEQTAAKQQLGVKPTEMKILGVKWEKENDTLKAKNKELFERDEKDE